MRLGNRLEAVLSAVPKGVRVADVGTDHGKLSLELLAREIARHVIATDVSAPSLDKARRLIGKSEYAQRAEFRLGDGLSVINADEVDAIVISGMGGMEIKKIVENGPRFDNYVLSPQRDMRAVREAMSNLGYAPRFETVVREGKKFYFIMTFAVGSCNLSENELEFGRHNLQNPSSDFVEYIRTKLHEYQALLDKNPDLLDVKNKVDKYAAVLGEINEG